MLGVLKAHYDCIQGIYGDRSPKTSKKIDIPVLVMHGDDDQIVPIAAQVPCPPNY